MQYVFFWVIPRRLGSNSRRFGTLYRFHLHGQVDEECLGMGRVVYLYLKGLWQESGGANGWESDRTGRGEWSHNRLWKGEAYI
jgi:hypothetical protein